MSFLTIITRTCRRPKQLAINIQSVKDQTDPDVQQVFINDDIGRGMTYASHALYAFRNHLNIQGQYVMILDDDDKIINKNFVSELKKFVKDSQDPDMVIFKGKGKKIYPPEELWKKAPIIANIASFCFVVKKELYMKHIKIWARPVQGDYHFIRFIYDNYETVWLDSLVAQCQSIRSYGKTEY